MWVRQELSPENVGQLACDRNVTDDYCDAAIATMFLIGSGVLSIDTTGTISCSYVVIQHDKHGYWVSSPKQHNVETLTFLKQRNLWVS